MIKPLSIYPQTPQFCGGDFRVHWVRGHSPGTLYVASIMTGQYSILIIDDDENLRRTLGLILEHAGYAVTTAANADEGLRAIREQSCDLILLDLVMPDVDGRVLLPVLRQVRPRMPVLVLTGQTLPDLEAELWKKGARGFLPKPVDPECILTQIYTLLIGRLIPGSEAEALGPATPAPDSQPRA
jgi:DNA-binding NtrC family response regulator